MAALEALKNSLKNAGDIHGIVRTMKLMAAVRIKHYQKAEAGLEEYEAAVERSFALLLKDAPGIVPDDGIKADGITGVIVFGSDQGLAGSFNEQAARALTDYLAAEKISREKLRICVMGHRLVRHLDDAGVSVDEKLGMPLSLPAASAHLRDLLAILNGWRKSHQFGKIILIRNRMKNAVAGEGFVSELLPPSEERIAKMHSLTPEHGVRPLTTVSHETVVAALLDHYIFSGLFHGLIGSLRSENAVRLAAMQQAEKHIEEFLDELTLAFNQERQNQITDEIMDIVGAIPE
ncbi:MAG: F0F1 ATP synthase subunit gamma [Spirochaetes bacterium]|nr:F0F1 ATP synthase subunit gamma [Spirochaetota bacterium]